MSLCLKQEDSLEFAFVYTQLLVIGFHFIFLGFHDWLGFLFWFFLFWAVFLLFCLLFFLLGLLILGNLFFLAQSGRSPPHK